MKIAYYPNSFLRLMYCHISLVTIRPVADVLADPFAVVGTMVGEEKWWK
jgi:hypothetical protein